MRFEEILRMLDKKATYFWEKRDDGRFALVNALTLKTATGVRTRLDALKLQGSLCDRGFTIAKLNDGEF